MFACVFANVLTGKTFENKAFGASDGDAIGGQKFDSHLNDHILSLLRFFRFNKFIFEIEKLYFKNK